MKHFKENYKKGLFVRMCLFLTFILIGIPQLASGSANFMDVKVKEENSKIKIDIITDKPVVKYDSSTLDKPPSIVINLNDTQGTAKELIIGRDGITGINLISHEGPTTRVVIGLIKLLPYQIQNLKNGIEVVLDNPYHGYQLTTIGVQEDEFKVSLSISATSPPQYKYFDLSNPNRIIIDFLNAETKIGEVKVTSKIIKNILPSQRQVDPVNVSRVIVELTEFMPYQVFSEGNQVILELTKSKVVKEVEKIPVPSSTPQKEVLPKVKEAPSLVKKVPGETVRKKKEPKEKRAIRKSTEIPKPPVQEIKPEEEVKPKEKIESTLSLDFKDADILDVLRLIAHKIGMNIFPGKDVKGMVTVKLDNVSWQKALDLILKNLGYAYIIEDNVLRVDSPTVLLGDTTTRIFKLNYAKASEIVAIVSNMMTTLSSQQARKMGGVTPVLGTVIQDARTNAVIVTDIPYNVNQIEEIIKKLDTITPQVMIEAKLIEVTLDTQNALGFRWSVGKQVEGQTEPRFSIGSYQTDGWPLGDRGEFLYSKIPTTSGDILNLQIEALVTEGKANILSTPKILALDNEQAQITVGEDIPYQQTTKVQTGEVMSNVSFRSVGVKLAVTPHINPDNFIMLDVKPEVSSLKEWVGGMPVITTKDATSKLVVKDGETVVIGGIISDQGTEKLNKVPLLGDLPFVGPLFRKKMTENRKTELLIFITPYIKKY